MLPVADMQPAIDFYTNILGLKLVYQTKDGRNWLLKLGLISR